MKINGLTVSSKQKALMIAEEGQANQGDINIALEMARFAKDSGADGIEYQLFFADEMYAKNDPGHKLYKSRELQKDEIIELIYKTHALGLLVQVAGLSPKIIELCTDNGADVFVINATDLNNPEIIDATVDSGKPFWFATLMGTVGEIDWAVEYALTKNAKNFGLLHGQHVMSSSAGSGVPANYLQLDCISAMERKYGVTVGFVDHTATTFVPALAATLGASCITKHLSPHEGWVGPDSSICLSPKQWKVAKDILDYSYLARGSSKELSIEELGDKSLFRRSLHTTQELKAGSRLERSHLVALRPGLDGINPSMLAEVIGKNIYVDLLENEQLKSHHFFKS